MALEVGGIVDARNDMMLARALRAARGSMGLRDLAARSGISKSAIARYESGATSPPRRVVDRLDGALDQRGALVAIARRQVGVEGVFSWRTYPADWDGPVWLHVKPAGRSGVRRMTLRWGPWEKAVVRKLPPDGVVFLVQVTRRPNSSPTTASVRANQPVHVHWGIGSPTRDVDIVDVSDGWSLTDRGEVREAAADLILAVLTACGRTTTDLAEFLGVTESTVERWLAPGDRSDAPVSSTDN